MDIVNKLPDDIQTMVYDYLLPRDQFNMVMKQLLDKHRPAAIFTRFNYYNMIDDY